MTPPLRATIGEVTLFWKEQGYYSYGGNDRAEGIGSDVAIKGRRKVRRGEKVAGA